MKNKIIGIFLAAVMLITMAVIPAGAEETAAEAGLVGYYGFDEASEVSGKLILREDSQKGSVAYFDGDGTKTDYTQAVFEFAPDSDSETVTLSFDIAAGQTNQWSFTQLLGTADGKSSVIGAFYFTADGKFGYMKSPVWTEQPKSEADGTLNTNYVYTDYEAGQWFHIDIVFDTAMGKAKWYKDGVLWGDGNDFRTGAVLNTLHITMRGGSGFNDSPTGEEHLLFDNITCFSTRKGEPEAALGYSSIEDKTLRVVFSESMSDVRAEILNTKTADAVSIDTVSTEGNICEIKYTGELEANTQYVLKIKKGSIGFVSGTLTKDKLFYFRTGGSSEVAMEVFNYDFDTKTPTGLDSNYVTALDAPYNNVLAAKATSKNTTELLPISVVFEEADRTAISFDFMLPEVGRAGYIWFMGEAANKPVTLVFNKYGYLIAGSGWLGDTTAAVSYDDIVNYLGSYLIVGQFESGEWINFKLEYDKDENVFRYYIDGVEVKAEPAISGFNKFDNICIIQQNNLTNTTVGNAMMYMDNLKFEKYIPEATVEEVLFTSANGEVYGALSEVGDAVYKVDMTFSTDIDADTLTADNVKLFADTTPLSYEAGVYDPDKKTYTIYPKAVLKRGQKLKVKLSGIKQNDGITPISDFETVAIQGETEEKFSVEELYFADAKGRELADKGSDAVYGHTVVINNTNSSKPIIAAAAEYTNNKLTFFDMEVKTLEAGEIFVANSKNGALAMQNASGSEMSLSILNGGELRYPLVEKTDLGVN